MPQYAKIKGNEILKTGSRSTWYYPKNHSDHPGEKITDDSIYAQGGIDPDANAVCWRPISDENKPSYDPETEKPPKPKAQSEWEIKSDRVIKVWDDPVAKSLDEVKDKKLREIEQERVRRTELMPYTTPDGVDVEVKLKEEPPGKPRQTWLSGTCAWALAEVQDGNPDETDNLIAEDDSLHTMKASDWVQFGKALKAWVRDNLMITKQHMQAVRDLETVNDVIDYDFSEGWPS